MSAWGYTWKSSDGVRHEGEMKAASKDEVFAALRAQGIRAIKVFEKERPSDARKWRVVAAVAAAFALLLALVVAVVSMRSDRDEEPSGDDDRPVEGVRRSENEVPPKKPQARTRPIESQVVELVPGVRVATPRPRMHMDISAVTNINEVFRFESERYLTRFACPGADVPQDLPPVPGDLYDALEADILIQPDDSAATVNLKRVVAGLKDEARRHISVGADLREWTDFLIGRQRMEAQYRERIIENFADDDDEMHRRLRAMGFE